MSGFVLGNRIPIARVAKNPKCLRKVVFEKFQVLASVEEEQQPLARSRLGLSLVHSLYLARTWKRLFLRKWEAGCWKGLLSHLHSFQDLGFFANHLSLSSARKVTGKSTGNAYDFPRHGQAQLTSLPVNWLGTNVAGYAESLISLLAMGIRFPEAQTSIANITHSQHSINGNLHKVNR